MNEVASPASVEDRLTQVERMLRAHDAEDSRRFAEITAQLRAASDSHTDALKSGQRWAEVIGFLRMLAIIAALLIGQGHTPAEFLKMIMEAVQ